MIRLGPLVLALASFWISVPAAANNITLSVPSKPPKNASGIVDTSFLGWAFEEASFYNYSFDANGNPNTFSQNLIHSVQKRTGGAPIIRVGGTSGDYGRYNGSQTQAVNLPATQNGPAFQPPYLQVGKSYFEAFKNFPDAEYIFMVPLAHRHLNNTIEWTRQGLNAIGDQLLAVEIGNEPDLYSWFTASEYVKEFVDFEKTLSTHFPEQLGNGPIYQALDTASFGAGNLTVSESLKAGINSTGSVRQVAYHLYQTTDVPGAGLDWLQTHIANHAAIVQAMAVFEPDIQYLQKHAPGVPFILSEVGNSLGTMDIEQRNVLATALWNVDYQLNGLAIGVTRVNNQQIVTSGFQMWEPVVSEWDPPLVRANYYSQPFVAAFIGDSGSTRVSELAIESTDMLSAYVAYDNDEPTRIAIVNFQLWTPANGTRSSTNITLTHLPSDITSAKLYTLTSLDGAYANDTLTYRGLQWTYQSNGHEVRVGKDSSSENVKKSRITVTIEATSAVLVELPGDAAKDDPPKSHSQGKRWPATSMGFVASIIAGLLNQ